MKNIFISIFCIITTIAFILCGSCGFNNDPQDYALQRYLATKPPKPPAPKFQFPVVYLHCDNAQLCLVLESELYYNKVTSNAIISKTTESHDKAASLIITEESNNGSEIQIIKASPPNGVDTFLLPFIYDYYLNAVFKDQNGYSYYSSAFIDQFMMAHAHRKPKTTDRVDKVYIFECSQLNLLYESAATELVSNLITNYYTPR